MYMLISLTIVIFSLRIGISKLRLDVVYLNITIIYLNCLKMNSNNQENIVKINKSTLFHYTLIFHNAIRLDQTNKQRQG